LVANAARKGADIQTETAPVSTVWPVLSAVDRDEGAERHARERAIGIFSRSRAPWCSRASYATASTVMPRSLIEVNRALPGLLSGTEMEAPLSIVDKLMT
jgi:hypothetical protein